jgi:tetratricopeptide (TPR) repeat protein
MLKQYLVALLLLIAISPAIYAQQAEHQAVALYHGGKYADAAKLLEKTLKDKTFRTDARLWNFYGLSLLELEEYKDARKAFQGAVKLDVSNSAYQLNLAYALIMVGEYDDAKRTLAPLITPTSKDAKPYYFRAVAHRFQGNPAEAERDAEHALALDPGFGAVYVLLSGLAVDRIGGGVSTTNDLHSKFEMLGRARDVLRKGLSTVQVPAERAPIEERARIIGAFYDYFAARPPVASVSPSPEPGVTPLKILSIFRAEFTGKGRDKRVNGAIRVAVLFGASGKVEHVLFLKTLGYGLENQVLKAIRKIKFEPKKKDGQPVPAVKLLEYTFSVS